MKSGATEKIKKNNENRGVKGILQGTDAHQGRLPAFGQRREHDGREIAS